MIQLSVKTLFGLPVVYRERLSSANRQWRVFVPGQPRLLAVQAPTRCEGRATIKKALGIGRKGRLPVGTEFIPT